MYRFEHIELPAKLLDYFLRSNKSNINQTHTLSQSVYESVPCDMTQSLMCMTQTHTHESCMISHVWVMCESCVSHVQTHTLSQSVYESVTCDMTQSLLCVTQTHTHESCMMSHVWVMRRLTHSARVCMSPWRVTWLSH